MKNTFGYVRRGGHTSSSLEIDGFIGSFTPWTWSQGDGTSKERHRGKPKIGEH